MKRLLLVLLMLPFLVTLDVASEPATAMKNYCWDIPIQNTDGSPLTDLAGFKIYSGVASNSYSSVYDVADPAQSCILISSTSVPDGKRYATITAYNTGGVESPYSPEINFILTGGEVNPLAPGAPSAFRLAP